MAAKKVWVTWLPGDPGAPPAQPVLQTLGRYGLQVSGAQWDDELEKASWVELGTHLLDPAQADIWVVAGTRADLQDPRKRYALSLLRAVLHETREVPLPMLLLGIDWVPAVGELPLLLQAFGLASTQDSAWPAKVVAAGFAKAPAWPLEFRFNVIAHALIGQWFEFGPLEGEWAGVMVGTDEPGRILDHAVGERGQLPERTVLEYPLQGMEVAVGDTRYTACAVQNRLTQEHGYFLRVDGFPRRLIVGGHPGDDQGEVTIVDLC